MPASSPQRLGALAAVVSALLVIAVGAVAKLPETVLPISTDSGMYATYGRMLLHGGRPYVDFYDVHPPLAYLYWALVGTLAGTDWSRTCLGSWGSLLAPQPCVSLLAHSLDLALTCLTGLLAYAIARRLGFSALVGVLAAVFITWFANESMISMEGSNPTKLTLLPGTLAVYAFVRAVRRTPTSWGWALLAGAAGMVSVLAKQPGLMTLFALFAYALASPGARRTLCPGLGLGALGVLAVTCLYLWRIGSLPGLVDEAWVYNGQRFLIGYWQTPAGLTSPATRIDRVAVQAAGLLFVGAVLGGLALWLGPVRPYQRLLLVWAVLSLVAVAGFREFAQVVSSLSLLAAVGIGAVWSAASKDGLGLGRPLAGRIAVLTVFGAIFALSTSFQVVELRRAWFERGPSGTPADPEIIAGWLRSTAPGGPIFVWGNGGQIYALSGREPASRFVIAEFTDGIAPRVTLSRAQLIDDVRANSPSVVVLAPHSDDPDLTLNNYPAFAQFLAACYQKTTAGAPLPSWGIYIRLLTAQPGCG